MNKPLQKLMLGLVICLLTFAIVSTAFMMPSAVAQESGVDGLVTVESINNVDDTVNFLTGAIEEKGLLVARVIDHAANAESVGLELRPTKLIVFGNPTLGTQLMNNGIQVAIDLPQKYLVWEDANGTTYVSYNSPQYLVDRHGLTGPQDVIEMIGGALQNFANMVTLPAPDVLPVTGRTWGGGAAWWLALIGLLAGGAALGWGHVRRRVSTLFWLTLLVAGAASLLPHAATQLNAQAPNGLLQLESAHGVDETVARLQDEIAARGLNTMMVIDHAANAASVGQTLRPTKLIFFGNPQVGTQLMQSKQSVGIDLPQKYLVWEDADGLVHVAYNEPTYLGTRHAITDHDELLGNVTATLADIASTATSE